MLSTKSIFLAAALSALTTGLAAAAPALVLRDLNLRAGPGPQHPSLGIIPGGSTIDVHSCGAGWCSAFWAGRSGFVSQSYLDLGGGAVFAPRVYPAPLPPVVVYPGPYYGPYYRPYYGPYYRPYRRWYGW